MREEIARRFCIAYLSYQLGVTYQTASKKVANQPIGELWLQLADIAIDLITRDPLETLDNDSVN